eukprot:scaffold650916_cov43-Prasinocladus_malaysianus.AAC.1
MQIASIVTRVHAARDLSQEKPGVPTKLAQMSRQLQMFLENSPQEAALLDGLARALEDDDDGFSPVALAGIELPASLVPEGMGLKDLLVQM